MAAYDLEDAHRYSCNNKPTLEKDSLCGCFYCLEIYDPVEIKEWITEDTRVDEFGTAICARCGVDSVIGESSGYPMTKEFLTSMKKRWFGMDE